MPLVNPGSTKGQTRSKSSQNNTFHGFLSNPSFSEIFGIKFDLNLTLGGAKNPNFDLAIRMSWNQFHCEDYQILIPTNVHGSKSELEWQGDAPIDALLTSKTGGGTHFSKFLLSTWSPYMFFPLPNTKKHTKKHPKNTSKPLDSYLFTNNTRYCSYTQSSFPWFYTLDLGFRGVDVAFF